MTSHSAAEMRGFIATCVAGVYYICSSWQEIFDGKRALNGTPKPELVGAETRWQCQGMGIDRLIVKTPGTCGGRARITGRRVPVSSIYRWFLNGDAPEDILSKYEKVTLAEIYAAIAYALSNREEIAAEIEEEDRLERARASGPMAVRG